MKPWIEIPNDAPASHPITCQVEHNTLKGLKNQFLITSRTKITVTKKQPSSSQFYHSSGHLLVQNKGTQIDFKYTKDFYHPIKFMIKFIQEIFSKII